jgi:hypothetical protein
MTLDALCQVIVVPTSFSGFFLLECRVRRSQASHETECFCMTHITFERKDDRLTRMPSCCVRKTTTWNELDVKTRLFFTCHSKSGKGRTEYRIPSWTKEDSSLLLLLILSMHWTEGLLWSFWHHVIRKISVPNVKTNYILVLHLLSSPMNFGFFSLPFTSKYFSFRPDVLEWSSRMRRQNLTMERAFKPVSI